MAMFTSHERPTRNDKPFFHFFVESMLSANLWSKNWPAQNQPETDVNEMTNIMVCASSWHWNVVPAQCLTRPNWKKKCTTNTKTWLNFLMFGKLISAVLIICQQLCFPQQHCKFWCKIIASKCSAFVGSKLFRECVKQRTNSSKIEKKHDWSCENSVDGMQVQNSWLNKL